MMLGLSPWPARKPAGEAPEVGIGMMGYAFMGKAHTNAFKKIPYMIYPPPAVPRLVAIAGRDESAVREAAQRYGYETLLYRLARDVERRPGAVVR
jgi:predicted dehydrogenase